MAIATKASAFSFESLKTCSSFQATKFPICRVIRLTYLVMHWSLVSYSPFTCPYHQLRVASYVFFFLGYEDCEVNLGYDCFVFGLFWKWGNPKVMKRHPHSKSTSRSCLVPFPIKEFLLKSQLVPTPLTLGEIYIEYRTHSVQLPTEPFVLTERPYV